MGVGPEDWFVYMLVTACVCVCMLVHFPVTTEGVNQGITFQSASSNIYPRSSQSCWRPLQQSKNSGRKFKVRLLKL